MNQNKIKSAFKEAQNKRPEDIEYHYKTIANFLEEHVSLYQATEPILSGLISFFFFFEIIYNNQNFLLEQNLSIFLRNEVKFFLQIEIESAPLEILERFIFNIIVSLIEIFRRGFFSSYSIVSYQ